MRLLPVLLVAFASVPMSATAESPIPPQPDEAPRTALVIHAGAGVIERRSVE